MHNACFACHGELGYGGAGPGFRGDKMLAADDYVVGRILFGGGIMPPFGGELSDVEIASVGTYIRNNWGNQFGAISPDAHAGSGEVLLLSAYRQCRNRRAPSLDRIRSFQTCQIWHG